MPGNHSKKDRSKSLFDRIKDRIEFEHMLHVFFLVEFNAELL